MQHYFAEYAPPPLYQPYRYWLKKSLLKYKLGQLARVNRARDHEGGLPVTLVTRDSDVESSSRASSSSTLTHPSDSAPLSTTHAPREHSALTRGKCQSATRHIGSDTCHTEPRTVWSKDGIAQNPTGWHNNVRVWGGGIVKVRAEEWRAWDIDRDEATSDLSATSATSVLGESVHRTLARTTHSSTYCPGRVFWARYSLALFGNRISRHSR